MSDLDIPDPRDPRPTGDSRCVFIAPTLAPGSRVVAGDYSYYDASEDTAGFEESRVRYAFGGERLLIGRYCAVAAGVSFLMSGANHVQEGPTTYPFYLFDGEWRDALLDPLIEHGSFSKGDTVIGNDVLLGRGATVLPGVRIGDGAVIGASSVVAADVPPYAVVAGNPARVVRLRYPSDDVATLLELRWWDWPVEAVTRHLPALVLGTPADLLSAARAEGLVQP